MALLSYTRDMVIRSYYGGQDGDAFEAALYDLAKRRLDATANFRYFFQAGSSHTMLYDPVLHSTDGVSLYDWLAEMVDGDLDWRSRRP